MTPFKRGSFCYRLISRNGNMLTLSDQHGTRLIMSEEKLTRILNRFKK